VVGFVYWLYKQRIEKILAIQRTRNAISKDLHDEIGTALSSITLMNASLKNKIISNPGEAIGMADKIETTSREMIGNMSDIVWSINPGNDTIEKLVTRLQQFAGDVMDDSDTVYKLTINEGLLDKPIEMELRRDIYLVCKEIINNAAKYAGASRFELALSLEKNDIRIQANDDGAGFDEATVKKGNGLSNIKQRIQRHRGGCEMRSAVNKGTSWDIRIPL
jgi:signal transduction histidine kinase